MVDATAPPRLEANPDNLPLFDGFTANWGLRSGDIHKRSCGAVEAQSSDAVELKMAAELPRKTPSTDSFP